MKTRIFLLLQFCLAFLVNAQVTNHWNLNGPIAFPENRSGAINGIGRICQFKFHPSNPAKMYAVSARGGLWTSSDTANSWKSTGTDLLPPLTYASVCIDPNNDQIIYLGTGDPNYYSNGYGVWKSEDGGKTWRISNTGMGNRLVVEILTDKRNSNVLIAATNYGIYKSTDAGASWAPKYKGGKFTDLIFKPSPNTRTLYASTMSEFLVSEDMGETWVPTPLPFNGVSGGGRIAVSKADSNRVYLSFVGTSGLYSPVLRSNTSGKGFFQVKPANSLNLLSYNVDGSGGSQGNYNFDITADPSNADLLYSGGNTFRRSENGGADWDCFYNWALIVHTDMHHLEVSPYDGGKLFNANDGGVWLTKDRGQTYVPKNNGLSTTECYHAAQSPVSRDTFYIGTQDNGALYMQGKNWFTNKGGDVNSNMAVEYNTTGRVYYPGDEYTEYNIHGSSMQLDASWYNMDLPFKTNGDANMVISPSQHNVSYVSYENSLYINTTTGTFPFSVRKIKDFEYKIKAIAVSPVDARVFYVITDKNHMFRTLNGLDQTPSFTELTLLPSSVTESRASIAVVKSNPDYVYITCGQKVYRSIDKGNNWTEISEGLLPVNNIKLINDFMTTDESMYLATPLGVYYRNNTMNKWLNYSEGLPTVTEITDMTLFSNNTSRSVLRVSFYGRGVWESPLYKKPAVQVALTSPAPDAYISEGTVTLSCSTSSTSGTVNKVEYYRGDVLIGFSTTAPFTYTWTNAPAGSYQLSAKAFTTTGEEGYSSSLHKLNVLRLRTPENPSGTASGMEYKYFNNVPDLMAADVLSELTPSQEGIKSDLSVAAAPDENNFGYIFSGYVNIPSDGIYTFYTSSDDGSLLYIGNSVVVNNDGYHGLEEKSGKIGLKAGKHAMRVIYFQGYGDRTLNVAYEGPALSRQTIPAAALSYANNPVTVSLTSPASGTVVVRPGSVILEASAVSAPGNSITEVQFLSNGVEIGKSTTSPFTFTWPGPASGTYTITAKASDNAGNSQTSAPVTVIVDARPTVSITSPLNGASVSSPFTFQVNAADVDGTVARVDYYYGPFFIGTSSAAPFSYTWHAANAGTYLVHAQAYDNHGVQGLSSEIRIEVAVTNQPPVVSLTSPVNNARFTAPATITLSANASDQGGSITKVEFLNGTDVIQTVTSPPYTFNWTGVAANTYSISARATDNLGATTTTGAITVTVNPASAADINGPDCGTSGASLAYQLNPAKWAGATNINWYYQNAGTVSPQNTASITLKGASPFAPANLCVGFSHGGTYRTLCKYIATCTSPGTATEEIITAVDVEYIGSTQVKVFPNPAHETVRIAVESQEGSALHVDLTDDLSKSVLQKTLTVSKGSNVFSLDVTELKNGSYTMILTKGEQVLLKRIIIAK